MTPAKTLRHLAARALSDPKALVGGPLPEILTATPAMPNGPSVHPCESPGRRVIDQLGNPELWIPIDCGRCAPCEARAAR